MDNLNTKEIAKCGLMAALTFIFTYTFKIPSPNGYTHLGDCFVLLGVLVLGRKKGALAGGIGAALSDLLGGYMVWVLPTFFIKAIMAYVMGTIVEKVMPENKFNYITCKGASFRCGLRLNKNARPYNTDNFRHCSYSYNCFCSRQSTRT